MELTNSKRFLYTASYVTTELTPEEQHVARTKFSNKISGAYTKANTLRAMDLKLEDLSQLRKTINASGETQHRDELEKLLSVAYRLAETSRPISTMELAPMLAPISFETISRLVEFSEPLPTSSARNLPLIFFFLEREKKILPIGRIHLERIEMYPAGVEKGELVFSVPMAPGETVTISHKEWTTTTRGFEEIAQDYFESYSERGVAEKTDVSISSENEVSHSNSLDFGSSLSGSYMGVTLTTTLGIKSTTDEKQSAKNSMQRALEVTEKASARSRKEHKVSMKLETKMGTEDSSGKTITNPSATPVRIDYYRMMRKWRTNLYRYGLRQTYDITIPLPGVRLWALHKHVAALDKEIRIPFTFTLKAEDINVDNWREKAKEFGVPPEIVPRPPRDKITNPPLDTILPHMVRENDGTPVYAKIDFEVPQGYVLEHAVATAKYYRYPGATFVWHKGKSELGPPDADFTDSRIGDLKELYNLSGSMSASYYRRDIQNGIVILELRFKVTEETITAWKIAAWKTIKASAEARYHDKIAYMQEERDRLWRLLNGKDTLKLRRLEREELLRLVMQWLMGPAQPLASNASVQNTFSRILKNEIDFQDKKFDGESQNTLLPTFKDIDKDNWYNALLFGDAQVKFVHQAIEWENLLYFLYPYFWGSEKDGRDRMLFEHHDPEHERFLRAGYVRMVLPVRPGFEKAFTELIETGVLSEHQVYPYMEISKEIMNFAKTNYSGIPPANPEEHARPLLYPEQRATWEAMQKVMEYVDAFKAEKNHYPKTLDEIDIPQNEKLLVDESGVPVDAWGNPFVYKMPGLGADYDLISLGANNQEGGEGLEADISSAAGASLIATWFDYTPTSALDIEVVTKPEVTV